MNTLLTGKVNAAKCAKVYDFSTKKDKNNTCNKKNYKIKCKRLVINILKMPS